MITIYAQRENEKFVETITLDDLKKNHFAWYWVDFEIPTETETKLLESYFRFHPLAVEDCMHDLQRPKLDYYDDHTFFVIHSLAQQSFEKKEIDIFIGDHYIVTYHKERSTYTQAVGNLLKRKNNKAVMDEYYVFYQLLDFVVDQYFPMVYEIEDHINAIEDNTNKLSMEELLEQLFDRRGELLTLRQTVHPMRDLLYRILNTHHLDGVHERKEYFADIHDHLIKVADIIASNREMTQDIRDSYLSLNAHQTNRTMQVLTVISVIFMPLTFIVGIYGMNFTFMPELDEKYGYLVVWLIMLIISIGMYVWFRKKGWFD
ncbi:magnesium and cobalt transport protein CorA [Virgibacillus phasianinus]|uniref:Magnesium transport protein CorA n=1 Tax=Virgibacillus phasianinus TaxID=2017483 RepID=A0A220U4N1_9BACI|nr:magnesium/cobalt transporter CorA [Virgibacillus phasianinus]ASK62791.1 magnesium and cobalt transport protein CorA [Virgibacillus phasianinus]